MTGPNTIFACGGNDGVDGGAAPTSSTAATRATCSSAAGATMSVAGDQGNDKMNAGYGDDFLSGHEGMDTVSYQGYSAPVTVTLDREYNDGAAGQQDNVLNDIEIIVGGSAGDTLTGDANPQTLIGGPGADTLVGLGGLDTLHGGTENDALERR